MIIARQSTARTVIVGPILDASGVAVTDGVVADLKISKNGAAPAALNGSATLTHRHTGHYSLALTASDLDTVGSAQVAIDDTVNGMQPKDINVIEEVIYDAMFAASANAFTGSAGSTTLTALAGGSITAAVIATGAVDADAIAADAVTEIQTGLATAAVVTAIKAVTDLLPDAGALTQIGADAATAATEATGANVSAGAAQSAAESVQDTLADLTEDDGGTPRFTANTLEQAPTGGSAPTVDEIADEVETRTIAAVTTVNGLAANTLTASALAADAVTEIWAAGTRTLTAGTNIVLAKGTGVTGFNDLSAAQVNTKADTALSDYDPPTRAELTSDVNSVLTAVGDVPTNAELATALAAADDAILTAIGLLSIPTANANADALLDRANAIETGYTVRQAIKLMAASMAGKVSGADTNAPIFRSLDDSANRITATTTADGNRTAVTHNV
jgi:hypothetical protein